MTFSQSELHTLSPSTGAIIFHTPYASTEALHSALQSARASSKSWAAVPLGERKKIVEEFCAQAVKHRHEISREISVQMGRPVGQCAGEVDGMVGRARWMVQNCQEALADLVIETEGEMERYIKRVPLGVIAIYATWNFPLLTSVNTLVSSILSGNSVILVAARQTPLTAQRFATLFAAAGLPHGVLSVLHLSDKAQMDLPAHPLVNFVSFTGSVAKGEQIARATAKNPSFAGCGLELGGKDAAYVREDADVQKTAAGVLDGGMFNSGQSCCGLERVYVHEKVYDEFTKTIARLANDYVVGNPDHKLTTLGPVVSKHAAEFINNQIKLAIHEGARDLTDSTSALFTLTSEQVSLGTYLKPTILVDVKQDMKVMQDETFGPVLAIMKVSNDADAIELMNDSKFGLTASVWTESREEFTRILEQLDVGTVFMNRCDFLDPALSWSGCKQSGRGVSLSKYGFHQVTKTKSVMMRYHAN